MQSIYIYMLLAKFQITATTQSQPIMTKVNIRSLHKSIKIQSSTNKKDTFADTRTHSLLGAHNDSQFAISEHAKQQYSV